MRGRHNLIARGHAQNPAHIIRARDWGKYTRSYDGTKPRATAAINRKVDQCSRFSEHQTQHLMGWMARNFVICCGVSWRRCCSSCRHSLKKWLVLRGQLYNTDCNDKGNTLRPYLREKKTVVVLKTLVFERAWAPSLVHPCVIKSCLPLTSRTW